MSNGNGLFYFQPQPIGLDQPEIPNSLRGQYEWNGNNSVPPGWPVIDVYHRSEPAMWWSNLEPAQGKYNFAIINTYLTDAEQTNAATGKVPLGRLGFRIMAYWPDGGPGNITPSYVPTQPAPENGVPDWNSQAFLAGWESMIAALAAFKTSRGVPLKDDPRLGYVDIGGYGSFGEWHIYANGQPVGARITAQNAARVINAVVDNFPSKPVLMMTADKTFLEQALNTSPRVGVRVDCLGYPGFMGATIDQLANDGDDRFGRPLQDRWQVAPYVSEWCHQGQSGIDEAHQGMTDVGKYHFSLLSSGNFPVSWANLTSQQQDDFENANKIAGYRYRLVELGMPSQLIRGQAFRVFWTWANDGSAPTYDNWQIAIRLRDNTNTVVWSGASQFDLRAVFSSAIEEYETIPQIPSGLLPGPYTADLIVTDTNRYLAPMSLAIKNRQPDGSYTIGPVTVT